MKIFIIGLLFLAGVQIVACNRQNSSEKAEIAALDDKSFSPSEARVENNQGTFTTDSTGTPQQDGDPQKEKQPKSQPPAKVDWDKKIIKTATISAEVKNYATFYTSLREKVKSLGGYIAQENQVQSEYKIENSLTIKVPVDQFDNALVQLSANTEKINERTVSSQDVTTEMIDTRSRMEAKRQVRLRYMDLLKQAKNMEEILQVEKEVNAIQEEIESASGRINYLGHSSAFSTIQLTYYQVLNVSAKDDATPSFGTRLTTAFRIGWSWIGNLFIGLTSIWPLFLLIFICVFFYKKIKIKKPKQAGEA